MGWLDQPSAHEFLLPRSGLEGLCSSALGEERGEMWSFRRCAQKKDEVGAFSIQFRSQPCGCSHLTCSQLEQEESFPPAADLSR